MKVVLKMIVKIIIFYPVIYLEWEGFGTLILQNGDKFVGGFKDGMINGHGTYYRNGKDPVEGLWVNGITQNAAKKKWEKICY